MSLKVSQYRARKPLRLYCLGTVLALVCVASPLKVGVVSGDSMSPTLRSGQIYVLDRAHYWRRPASRGDVVVFQHQGTTYIKRVFAVGGDTVYLTRARGGDDSDDLVMDWELARVRRLDRLRGPSHAIRLVREKIPAGCCYVLGDNLDNSVDSRVIGLVPMQEIRGKVLDAPPPRAELEHAVVRFCAASPS